MASQRGDANHTYCINVSLINFYWKFVLFGFEATTNQIELASFQQHERHTVLLLSIRFLQPFVCQRNVFYALWYISTIQPYFVSTRTCYNLLYTLESILDVKERTWLWYLLLDAHLEAVKRLSIYIITFLTLKTKQSTSL